MDWVDVCALPFALVGLLVLYSSLVIAPPIVHLVDDLVDGERVRIQGLIEKETFQGKDRLLTVGEITARCTCRASYVGEVVEIEGYVDRFNDHTNVRVLSIRRLHEFSKSS